MNAKGDVETQKRDRAKWLRRLAEPKDTIDAALALRSIEIDDLKKSSSDRKVRASPEEEAARNSSGFMSALATLSSDLDRLIPAWIARFLEQLEAKQLEAARRNQVRHSNAHADLPAPDWGNFMAVYQLQGVLQAVGKRIDPHIGAIVKALETFGQDDDHALLAVLGHAGPAVASAVPKLLEILRERGISRWPSHLARALANASQFDDGVLVALASLLSTGGERGRLAAIEVLITIGPGARSTAGHLLALRNGSEAERCGMIHALAKQGAATPEVLAILEAAMRDGNGYVARAAAHALGELTPEPARFVPSLIAACDWEGYLHDESLPEAAVAALGRYGPRAHAALPRLRQFIEGPIKGRTNAAQLVREAIERIDPDTTAVGHAPVPRTPAEPLAAHEPLFAVKYREKQCYIDRQGKIALRTRFSWGEPFSEGRAIVHDDERRTFVIDREGRDVFQSDWDDIRPFSEGLAAVRKHRKWGFVNREGRVVIEPLYDSVTAFAEGLAGFEIGRTEERLLTGVSWTRPGKTGFIDRSGTVVIPAEWTEVRRFREGRAVVCTGGTMRPNLLLDGCEVLTERKYGYIDRTGRLVIHGEYDLAGSFSEGIAVVQIGDGIVRARYGYIDATGSRVIPLTLTFATDFKNGRAIVHRRGRRWRNVSLVINPANEVVSEVPYQIFQPFSEGLTAVSSDGIYGFIDIDGHWIIEPQFDLAEPFQDGLAEVQRGDWYGLIDRAGHFAWGPTTEGALNRVIETEWTS